MAGSTPNLGLYLPGGGSTGTWTPDEVADVDPFNQNMQKIDVFAGTVGVQTSRNQQYYGPAGAIASVTGMKLGDEYQESDGNKTLWRYDGSNWLTAEGGMWLVRPTSVVNGTIKPNGHVTPTGTFDNILINGVFTSRFRTYMIVADWSVTGGSSGAYFRFGVAGAPLLNSAYEVQNRADVGAVVSASSAGASNSPGFVGVAGFSQFLTAYVNQPADATKYTTVQIEGMGFNSGFGGYGVRIWNTVLAAHDGFGWISSTGGRLIVVGDVAVYGMA